jgi:hypothetical protein
MYLALHGSGSDRTPAYEVGIKLTKGSIQKLSPGRNPQLENISEQLPGEP